MVDISTVGIMPVPNKLRVGNIYPRVFTVGIVPVPNKLGVGNI